MRTDQLAICPNTHTKELTNEVHKISGLLREKAAESRQVSSLARTASELGECLILNFKLAHSLGASIMVVDGNGAAELDTEQAIQVLKHCTDTLHNFAKNLKHQAKNYEHQSKAQDHLTGGLLRRFLPQSKVIAFEKQSADLINQQNNYLQANFAEVHNAENQLLDIADMLGVDSAPPPLTPAVQYLMKGL